MTIARFFERNVTAIGQHFSASKDDLEAFLEETLVEVYFGENSPDNNAVWTGDLLVNLLARLYPRLAITGHPERCAAVRALASVINPSIDFIENPSDPNVRIAIGVGDQPQPPGTLCPGSSGWVASLVEDGTQSLQGPHNPYAASFAAGLAAAEAFRQIFSERLDDHQPFGNITVSLLDYSDNSGIDDLIEPVDIGNVVFAGLGAVGNAALWVLSRHQGLSGHADLVDHEPIELSNLQRYVLTSDTDEGLRKTDLAARCFSGGTLRVTPQPYSLNQYEETLGGQQIPPTICVSVDNYHDRRSAQALLPRLVINGYTGQADLGSSWHRFGNGKACLACLYYEEKAQSELSRIVAALGLGREETVRLIPRGRKLTTQQLRTIEAFRCLEAGQLSSWEEKHIQEVYSLVTCGNLGIAGKGEDKEVVPLAHQSVLAGILMIAELIKRTTSLNERSQDGNLISWGNVLKPPGNKWALDVRTTYGCICSDHDYLSVYRDKWGE